MPPLYPHDVLVRWAIQHGGYFHDDVEVVFSPEKGYHMVVRRHAKLEPKTRVVACPMPCTLSILNVIDAEGGFTCRGIKIPPAFLDKQPRETVECFFLMEHYLVGKKSWWAPYIATLPTPDEVAKLQFERPEDITWIQGTNLAAAFAKQTEQWKTSYERGMEQLRKINWRNAKSGRLTWELFRWASTIFTSRAFTSQVLSDTLPADRARPMGRFSKSTAKNFRDGCGSEHSDYEHLTKLFSEGFPVLVPVLDILNFRPLAQVEWQAGFSNVGLEVLETLEGGEEGFLAEIRPAAAGDAYFARGTINSPELELKCYIFRPEHPCAKEAKSLETALFSLDLLDGISALRATDREWQAMYSYRKTYFAGGLKEGHFEDFRNLLTTMSQLLMECQARLTTLHNTGPTSRVPQNLKQMFAHTYRDSQVDILQLASCVCQFVLRRAVGEGQENDEYLLQSVCSRFGLDQEQTGRLQSLQQQHRCFSVRNELFSFEHLLSDVPNLLASQLHQVLAELGKERRLRTDSMEVDLNASQRAKISFGLALPALLMNTNTLSQRFQAWFDRLTQWYPPEDPNWHYVPDRSITAPEDAPPPLLLDVLDDCAELLKNGSFPEAATPWLQPKMIAWGWNVMEEEGVHIPYNVLDDQGTEPIFLLYVPQHYHTDATSTTSRRNQGD